MKRLRSYETSPQTVNEKATKALATCKLHTPPNVLADALQGNPLSASKLTLAEDSKYLTDKLVELEPYMHKNTLESDLATCNEQHKDGLSSHKQQPTHQKHAAENGGVCTDANADWRDHKYTPQYDDICAKFQQHGQ